MKISIGKIVLLIIVVYFAIFAVININKEKDLNKEILEKVIIVNDGILNTENEGKLVLVNGKISYDKLVTFNELKEDFGTIKISRKVEDFIKYTNENNGETEYKWEERIEPLTNNDSNYLSKIVSSSKTSSVMIGDYKLDDYGLNLVPENKYYSDQEYVLDLTTTGLSYERDPWEEDLKEGDVRLTYKYYNLDKYPYMSILAVQKGNTFIPYKYDKKSEFYQVFTSKIDSKDKLSKELKRNVKKTTKGKILFILLIAGVGVFFIIDNRNSKKDKKEEFSPKEK